MNRFLETPVQKIIIPFFAATFIFWGTSWELPVFEIPPSYVWIFLILVSAIVLPSAPLNKKVALLSLILLGYFCIMSLVALPKIIAVDKGGDLIYLFLYTLKLIIGIVSLFVLQKVFRDFSDIRLFAFYSCLLFVPLGLLLWYQYKVQFGVGYVGVQLDAPSKLGKNSFATALLIIAPFFFVNLKEKTTYRLASFSAILIYLLMVYGIGSRSMLIISVLQVFLYLLYTLRKSISIPIVIGSIAMILIFGGVLLNNFLTRTTLAEEQVTTNQMIGTLSESHRARLARTAISGSIDNIGLGHGTATFRVNGARGVSFSHTEYERTETHNDYFNILYEQGVFGFFLIMFLVLHRIRDSQRLLRATNHPMVKASLISLISALLAMFFANFISALIFWLSLGLNIAIANILRRQQI